MSFFQVISFVARSTVSIFSVSFTLIRNWDANSISIEDPVFGASETDLVVPIPGGASGI